MRCSDSHIPVVVHEVFLNFFASWRETSFLTLRDIVTDSRRLRAWSLYYRLFNNAERNTMCNAGGIDRVLRIIVGPALISLVFVGPKTPWGWIGAVLLLTGVLGFCPACKPIGVNTCTTRQ